MVSSSNDNYDNGIAVVNGGGKEDGYGYIVNDDSDDDFNADI